MFHGVFVLGRLRQVGQVATVPGGPQVLLNSRAQSSFQGHLVGKWSVICRAEEAMRAGTPIRLRRIVAVVAFASEVLPVRVAAARVRLNAMTASTNQALFAANRPEAGAPAQMLSSRHGPAR